MKPSLLLTAALASVLLLVSCGGDLVRPDVSVESIEGKPLQPQVVFNFHNPNRFKIVERGENRMPWLWADEEPHISHAVPLNETRKFIVGPEETVAIVISYVASVDTREDLTGVEPAWRASGYFVFDSSQGPVCMVVPGTPVSEIPGGAARECRYYLEEKD
jgi:hypothetical protein